MRHNRIIHFDWQFNGLCTVLCNGHIYPLHPTQPWGAGGPGLGPDHFKSYVTLYRPVYSSVRVHTTCKKISNSCVVMELTEWYAIALGSLVGLTLAANFILTMSKPDWVGYRQCHQFLTASGAVGSVRPSFVGRWEAMLLAHHFG